MAKKKRAAKPAKNDSIVKEPKAPKAKRTTKKTTKATKTAKKATKKRAAKKTSGVAKEKAAKAAAEAMQDIIARARDHFRRAPRERAFYVADGRVLEDLRDLIEALDEMQEHVFNHHVTDDRHDFASWVHEVLQEQALADELRQAQRHPQGHQHVVYKHIVRRTW